MRRYRRRPLKSEINVVPFIDVVLVLLIIFMVAAPMMQTGQIKLPEVGQASNVDTPPMQVQVGEDGSYRLSGHGRNGEEMSLDALVAEVAGAQGENPALAVVISGDKEARYQTILDAMDKLQRAGVKQIGLLVQPQGTK